MSKLSGRNNILVLAAHPDDETLGCGATLAKLASEGSKIRLLTFTDGVGSRNTGEAGRNSKVERVADILGIHQFSVGTFPDNAMDSVPLLSICKHIEQHIEEEPDIIFTHFSGDLNIDHQIVTRAALTVFRPQTGSKTAIYAYHVPSSTDYNPLTHFDANTYQEVDQLHVDKKIEALRVYDYEMRPYPHSRSYENVINLMKTWGSEVGLHYCEKFKLIREIL
jgi:LmbE family N-acetylglucosaminyl deacetylase